MKGKISDINDLVTQPLKMFGALLYGPNEYRVNKNFDEIYKKLNQNNDEILSIIAHEVGHYKEHHIWLNIFFSTIH